MPDLTFLVFATSEEVFKRLVKRGYTELQALAVYVLEPRKLLFKSYESRMIGEFAGVIPIFGKRSPVLFPKIIIEKTTMAEVLSKQRKLLFFREQSKLVRILTHALII